ncbi:MAG: hypothetical protein ACREIR_05290 [Geminicoccaceae bacterium]
MLTAAPEDVLVMLEIHAALGDDAPVGFGGIAKRGGPPRDRRTGADVDHEVALVIQEGFAGSKARDFLLGGSVRGLMPLRPRSGCASARRRAVTLPHHHQNAALEGTNSEDLAGYVGWPLQVFKLMILNSQVMML